MDRAVNFEKSSEPIQKPIFKNNFCKALGAKNITFDGAFIAQWAEDIPLKTRFEIVRIISKTNFDIEQFVDIGADGIVYKIRDIPNFSHEIAVKISHNTDKNPCTGEMQRVNSTFQNERYMLPKTKGLNKGSQEFVAYLRALDGTSLLLTSFVNGERPDIYKRPLNEENLKNILIMLNNLDEAGILHRDLKKENVMVDENDIAGLLDYGAAITFDITDFNTNTKDNHFTIFEVPSNIKNFESTLFIPYLNELMKTGRKSAFELFTKYLKIRSKYIHKPNILRLQEFIKKHERLLSKNKIHKLKKMLDYQILCSRLESNISNGILDVEFLKAQIIYNAELAYKNEILLLNPFANVAMKFNALLACKHHENIVLELLKRPNPVEVKDYLKFQAEYSKYHTGKLTEWLKILIEQMLKCFNTPIKEASGYKLEIITQFLKNNLNNFEIPPISRLNKIDGIN